MVAIFCMNLGCPQYGGTLARSAWGDRAPNAAHNVLYSRSMADEDAVLKETMKHLEEASRRIRASRHLLREHALVDDPGYLRLVGRLSEALDVTEVALREARRRRDAG